MIEHINMIDWLDDGSYFHPNNDYQIFGVTGLLLIPKNTIFPAYLLNLINAYDISRSFKNNPCLYLLFYRKILVYVGISNNNVGSRLISHRDDKLKLFDSFSVIYGFENLHEMMDAEVNLINLNMPNFNVRTHRQLKKQYI